MYPYKLISILAAIGIFIVIAYWGLWRDLLRSAPKKAFSFHKFQTWLWTLVIIPCFVLYWGLAEDHKPAIDTTGLILLGISGITLIAADAVAGAQKAAKKADDTTKLKAETDSISFFSDILTDDDGNLSIGRLQQLVFTLVYVVIYISMFFSKQPYEYPKFDMTAFALMGISTGTYLIGKSMHK